MEHERLTAKDFSPELLNVFDQYVHGQIDRRERPRAAARLEKRRTASVDDKDWSCHQLAARTSRANNSSRDIGFRLTFDS